MTSIGFDVADAVLYSVILLQIPGTCMTLVTAVFVERIGRRRLILTGVAVCISGELLVIAFGGCPFAANQLLHSIPTFLNRLTHRCRGAISHHGRPQHRAVHSGWHYCK